MTNKELIEKLTWLKNLSLKEIRQDIIKTQQVWMKKLKNLKD